MSSRASDVEATRGSEINALLSEVEVDGHTCVVAIAIINKDGVVSGKRHVVGRSPAKAGFRIRIVRIAGEVEDGRHWHNRDVGVGTRGQRQAVSFIEYI